MLHSKVMRNEHEKSYFAVFTNSVFKKLKLVKLFALKLQNFAKISQQLQKMSLDIWN